MIQIAWQSIKVKVALAGLCLASFAPGFAQDMPFSSPSFPQPEDVLLELVVSTYPEVDYGEGDRATLIKRGEYLVKIGDCISCHTNSPERGEVFAGGLAVETPFGTFFSTNITPDKETGIGNWTEDDFIQAMHQGKLPDGSNLYPVFPYLYFNLVSEHDLRAIWAYLQSIPPVKQENRKNVLPFPLNLRFLQYGWKTMFFYPHEGQFEYDPEQSTAWNRGKYLVEGLGHCNMCHGPINIFGGPKRKNHLTGAFIDGYWAPNITKYGLKSATLYDVADVFAQGELINRSGPVAGPMAEVNHNSLSYLTEEDRLSIATYLKSVKSEEQYRLKTRKYKSDLKHGKQVYINVCIACHQQGQAGAPIIGNTANWELRVANGIDDLYRHTINGYNNMPVRGACVTCADEDIVAAVDYLVYNSLTRAQWQALQEHDELAKPEQTIADGKRIYQENCAVCHDDGKLGAPKLGDKEIWAPLLERNLDALILTTMRGKNNMPPKGGCKYCSTSEIVAAVKYMAQESTTDRDYTLW